MAKQPVKSKTAGAGGAIVRDLTHARHDPAHVLAPGLFRSLGTGDRKKLKLDVTYIHGEDRLEFKGHEPLGVDDMRVLQGLVAIAGPQGAILSDDGTASVVSQQLLRDLFTPPGVLVDAAKKPDSLVVKDSFRRLAREIGFTAGGPNIQRIRKCIERLFGVTVFVQRGKRRLGVRLLSQYASDEVTGDLYVALNPRLAGAIFGGEGIQHVRIELAEVRALQTDPARLIHQRLCGWIDPGKVRKARLTTLAEYVWPEPAATAANERTRRKRVRDALAELRALGWTITEHQDGVCEIGRPKIMTR